MLATLSDKIENCGRALPDSDRTYRTAFEFLANPCNRWHSGDFTEKRKVLKLVFAHNLEYDKSEDYRTAKTTLPLSMLGHISGGNKEMVGPPGLEPGTCRL